MLHRIKSLNGIVWLRHRHRHVPRQRAIAAVTSGADALPTRMMRTAVANHLPAHPAMVPAAENGEGRAADVAQRGHLVRHPEGVPVRDSMPQRKIKLVESFFGSQPLLNLEDEIVDLRLVS